MFWSNFLWNFFSWILASCWWVQKWNWVLTDFSNSRQIMQDPIIKPIAELDTKTLQDLLPEIPLWVKNPDYDRVGTWHSLSTTTNSPWIKLSWQCFFIPFCSWSYWSREPNSLDNIFLQFCSWICWSVEPNSLDSNFLFSSVVEFAGVKNPSMDGKEKG